MNFFGRKNVSFDDEDSFYEPAKDKESEGLIEEVEATPSVSAPSARQEAQPLNLGAGSIELKVVRPDKFEDVAPIAEHLLNHCTVVLNLEAANKDVCRRLLDFLSGVAFSIGGQIKRVNNIMYIVTPSNVDVSDTHVPVDDTEN